MVQTGTEYAAKPKLEMPTQIGLRYAMLEAVEAYKAQEASGAFNGKSPEEKAKIARSLVAVSAEGNALLKGAGTTDVAKAYFNKVIDSQSSPTNVVAFLDAIKAEDVKGVKEAIARNDDQALLKAAGGFSKAFREKLGQETLTGSFEGFLQAPENKETLSKLSVKPLGFTAEQGAFIDKQEAKFRSADEMDHKVYEALKNIPFLLKIVQGFGIGFPRVNDKIQEFEQSQYPVIQQGQSRSHSESSSTAITGGETVSSPQSKVAPKSSGQSR
jgi:hypothetical protein